MSRLLSPRVLITLILVFAIGVATVLGRDLDPVDLQVQFTALGIWAPLFFVLIFATANGAVPARHLVWADRRGHFRADMGYSLELDGGHVGLRFGFSGGSIHSRRLGPQ